MGVRNILYLRRMIWRTFLILALLSASSTSCKTGKKGNTNPPKTTTTLAPPTKSCEGKCTEAFKPKDPCQCNKQCQSRQNCCEDYSSFCSAKSQPEVSSPSRTSSRGSCQGKCNSPFDRKKSCQCNSNCHQFSNCCSDFDTLCRSKSPSTTRRPQQTTLKPSKGTCQGRCNEKFKPGNDCQCNANCNKFNNCCSDFNSTCPATPIPTQSTNRPNLKGSCSGKCHQPFSFKSSCQCNFGCENFNNCCSDYENLCSSLTPPNTSPKSPPKNGQGSCVGKCNQAFKVGQECQCNSNCNRYNNCCSDFNSTCLSPPPPSRKPGGSHIKSCRGKCNELVHSRDTCQCNPTCEKFNSCCSDYVAECKSKVPVPITKSCARRCNTKFKPGDVCQCNLNCHQFNNCCPDYDTICESPIIHSDGVVTEDDLKSISEHLLKNDVNNAGRSININAQERKRGCDKRDVAPRRLFTSVHSSVWEIPTIKTLVALLDNYDPNVRVNENETPAELREQDAFLTSILATPVMNATYYFLRQNGAFSGSKRDFRTTLKELWFGIYDRDGDSRVRTLGSSGFEHVFVGELKNNEVGGFHHWVFFVKEEQKGNVEYLGKRGEISLGQYGKGFTGSFLWKNQVKCTGSMTVGTSPEFDMALYTICAMARPNVDCKMTLHGKKVTIRAFEFSYRGRTHIGTAFPNFKQN